MNNVQLTTTAPHTFTLSGLGEAPFRVIEGHTHAIEKGCIFWCEHCGTTLKNRHFIKSSDSKVSIVGIDCLGKTGDQGLIDGAKRLKREAKHKQDEAEREKKLEIKRDEERAEFGFTKAEMAEKTQTKIDKFCSKFITSIEEHPVIVSLSSHGFELEMRHQAFLVSPYTDGMLSIIKKIHTKKVSGARANSKAFKEASVAAYKEVDDFNRLLTRKKKALDKLRDEWRSYWRQ